MRPTALSVAFACLSILVGCGNGRNNATVGNSSVVSGRVDATSPAADDGYIAWTSGKARFAQTATHSGSVLVRRGRTTFRENPPGTRGVTGGIDGGRLVYQELDADGSHLRLFDLARQRFLPMPRVTGIVWKPTISGRYVLFGRIAAGWDVVLLDLRTGRTTTLESNRAHAGYSVPGQIDGQYAVWLSCTETECNVWELDVRTARRRELPIPDIARRGVEGPSVAPDGTVYFGQGGRDCGSDVAIYRYRPGHAIGKLASLPRGTDFQYSYAEPVNGGVRVLFDLYDCRRKTSDIAAVLDRSVSGR